VFFRSLRYLRFFYISCDLFHKHMSYCILHLVPFFVRPMMYILFRAPSTAQGLFVVLHPYSSSPAHFFLLPRIPPSITKITLDQYQGYSTRTAFSFFHSVFPRFPFQDSTTFKFTFNCPSHIDHVRRRYSVVRYGSRPP